MKRKVKRIKAKHTYEERLCGIGTYRVTGKCKSTGKRKTIQFVGTRYEAERVALERYEDVEC